LESGIGQYESSSTVQGVWVKELKEEDQKGINPRKRATKDIMEILGAILSGRKKKNASESYIPIARKRGKQHIRGKKYGEKIGGTRHQLLSVKRISLGNS